MEGFKKLIVIMLLWLFASCERALTPKNPPNNPQSNFDFFWKTFDERYSFFETKNIDWDSVYAVQGPKINPNLNDTGLFNVMLEAMLLLKDGHVSLSSTVFPTVFYAWYADAPKNFEPNIIFKNYLKDDFYKAGPLVYKELSNVGYVYYGDLSKKLTDDDMQEMIGRLAGTKGLIVDIRNNMGGLVANAEKFVSYFNDYSRLTGYWLFKTGKGRNDFTEVVPFYISGVGNNYYKKPIVLLTNRMIYSAANDMVMMFKSLPNVSTMGDTTGGGGGLPMHYEMPNGWILALPTTQTLDLNKFNIERGIPPDITLLMTQADSADGIDRLIEKALQILDK